MPEQIQKGRACSGVYRITNLVDGTAYIGSSEDWKTRCRLHKWMLARHDHDNIHLQRAWDRDGVDRFEFKCVERVKVDLLLQKEQEWIDFYALQGPIYNLCPVAGSRRGSKQSEEYKARQSLLKKGKPKPPGFGAKISLARQGMVRSVITIERHRQAVLAFWNGNLAARESQSEKAKAAATPENQRRVFTPEYRAKMSASAKRRANTPEGRIEMKRRSLLAVSNR